MSRNNVHLKKYSCRACVQAEVDKFVVSEVGHPPRAPHWARQIDCNADHEAEVGEVAMGLIVGHPLVKRLSLRWLPLHSAL